MDTPSQRLKDARERAGKTPQEMERVSGYEGYWDLEDPNEDLYMGASLGEISAMCGLLGISPRYLFTGDADVMGGTDSWDLRPLAERIAIFLRQTGIGSEEFEERAGWELGTFLDDPSAAVAAWNIDCLRDVSRELGMDWVEFLPSIPLRLQ